MAASTRRPWDDAERRYKDGAAFQADVSLRSAAQEAGTTFLAYNGDALPFMRSRHHEARSGIAKPGSPKTEALLSQSCYEKVQKRAYEEFK